MRLGSYEAVNQKYTHEIIAGEESIATNHVGYTVKDAFPVKTKSGKDSADAFAYVNADKQAWEAPLPVGEYEVMIKGLDVYQKPVTLTSNGKVTVPPLSILLVRRHRCPSRNRSQNQIRVRTRNRIQTRNRDRSQVLSPQGAIPLRHVRLILRQGQGFRPRS